jgi:hypothetical protein
MQRALKYIDVRFDPKATVSDQRVIRRDGPLAAAPVVVQRVRKEPGAALSPDPKWAFK